MTIRHMIIFRTVCENGYNSTKAAEVLHMTQPAVSLAIKELEQYYGVHLFDRIGRRLQITDAGQHFLQYAIHISDLFSDMETRLRDWDSKGVLRIGASITIGSQFLPNYVKAFSELCPELDVRVTVEQSERLEQKILANELDCALIEGIAHDPNIVSEAYMEDHLSVICGTDKGWTQGQVISIEDFQRQRFLLREKGSGTREVFNRVVEQAGSNEHNSTGQCCNQWIRNCCITASNDSSGSATRLDLYCQSRGVEFQPKFPYNSS